MKLFLKISLFTLILAVSGCDIYEKDTAPVARFDHVIQTTQGSPTLINMRAYFNSVYQDGAKFKVLEKPTHGKVKTVDSDVYLAYEPNQPNNQQNDKFVAELVSSDGKRLALSTMHLSTVETCGKGEVVTYATISNGETFTLNLLDNDVFCNIVWNDAALYSRTNNTAYGNWIYSLDGPNHAATFSYTPKAGFTGKAEFYYDLAVNPDPEMEEWDQQMFDSWPNHPEIFEKYVSVRLVVEVTP